MNKRIFVLCQFPIFLLFFASISCSVIAEEPVDVLFLSKSSGFEHGTIKREKGELSHTEKVMLELADQKSFRVTVTKDAGMINKHTLKQYDVIHFYTSGDLTKRGTDGNPPMSTEGRDTLLKWVKNGGGFVGTHSATDSFRKWYEEESFPYVQMIGGAFKGHGKVQRGEMSVTKHPTTEHLEKKWVIKDEYYFFDRLTSDRKPLLTLNTNTLDGESYENRSPYANSWYKTYGEGRVWYTALGHRPEVWSNETFQEFVARGIKWAAEDLD